MAGVSPTSLDEYCKKYKTSFFDLKLCCLFCKHELTLQDLAGFASKVLSLVWRGDDCFACCALCLRLSAKFERENYTPVSYTHLTLPTICSV